MRRCREKEDNEIKITSPSAETGYFRIIKKRKRKIFPAEIQMSQAKFNGFSYGFFSKAVTVCY